MAANPYTAPQARVADIAQDGEYQPIKMWSATGRIGRLRYVAYTFGASVIVGALSGFLTAIVGPEIGALVMLLVYIPLIVFSILIAIQRSHDMNWTGWSVLLMLIPLVGLIWLFKPGTDGPNNYGNPPPPNTTGVKVLAVLFAFLFVIGIVAALALPALLTQGM